MKSPSGICEHCHAHAQKLELDHVLATCLGGQNTSTNLQWLCHSCHVKKTNNDLKIYRRRQRAHYRATMRILKKGTYGIPPKRL